jgi:RimJ/RimL family protein N-acetyltransferase
MGYGYEACNAVLNAGRWTFPKVVAVIAPQNTVSMRLAEKLGLRPWRKTVWSCQPRVVYRMLADRRRLRPGGLTSA